MHNMQVLPYCEECGEVRIPHALARVTSSVVGDGNYGGILGVLLGWCASPIERVVDLIFSFERVKSFANVCLYLRVGTLDEKPRVHDNTRTRALYEGAEARGVRLQAFRILGVFICFFAERVVVGKRMRTMFTIMPRPEGFRSPSLAWMDDKGILKQRLLAADLPCAKGGVAHTREEAVALFRYIGRPVIAKPFVGSRGRHTTLDIRTEDELVRAFLIAKQISAGVVIEAYLKGTVHRVTLVGGKPVAVARREYPHVLGDGTHTVAELVERENGASYRNAVHFRKLDLAHRADAMLRKQGLTLESVPEAGRMVILNDKNSRLHGTLTEDVTDKVHKDNIALFTRLGDMLGDPIVGVDFMIHDMARSWKEQPDAGVIECNSMPFIDVHHCVVSGRTINVAAYLWDEVFKG